MIEYIVICSEDQYFNVNKLAEILGLSAENAQPVNLHDAVDRFEKQLSKMLKAYRRRPKGRVISGVDLHHIPENESTEYDPEIKVGIKFATISLVEGQYLSLTTNLRCLVFTFEGLNEMSAGIKIPTYDLSGKVAIITGSTRGIATPCKSFCGLWLCSGYYWDASRKPATKLPRNCGGGRQAIGVATEITNSEHRKTSLIKLLKVWKVTHTHQQCRRGGRAPYWKRRKRMGYKLDADLKLLFLSSSLQPR